MRKLLIVVVLLGAGGAAAVEILVPRLAEQRIEQVVSEQSRDVLGVRADIDSFPAVTRLLLTSEVRRVTLTLDEVARRGITFTDVSVRFDGIRLDRTAMFRREVDLTDIESGTLIAKIPIDGLPGVGRIAERFDVGIEGNSLVASRAGRRIATIPLPSDLFPCSPTASLDSAAVVLSCTFDELPSFLVGVSRR